MLSQQQCPELGRPLRDAELIVLGIIPSKCGCGGHIRECGLHELATVSTPRTDMACCATCPDHPDAVKLSTAPPVQMV